MLERLVASGLIGGVSDALLKPKKVLLASAQL